MSQPRSISPGATYLLTRRVLRRHMLFRPDAAVTQLILYVLAVSARRYGIQVHALCAMSTHVHIVVTDVQGVLPRFLQFFHRLVALGTKVLRAWEGPVWDHEPTSVVRLMTPEAVVQKIAYVLANPVAAGLVRHAQEWPGAKVRVDELGSGVLRARRPDAYFDASNPEWPEEETLAVTLPPGIEASGADAFRREIEAEITAEEVRTSADMRLRGVPFLGASRAVGVSPYERATSFEELRKRNPTFAVGRKNEGGGAWQRAAAGVRAFRAAYREALERWCAGVRSVVFPAGTWWMRVLHAVEVSHVAAAG